MLIAKNNDLDIIEFREGMDNTWEIFDIKVMSKRQIGVGRSLIEEMIYQVNPRIIYAFTREENLDARAFYKAVGFNEILIPNFYEDGNAIMVIYENSLYRKI
jgi:ribosomal protein S18 acetylase RimI-like enzyme